MTRPPLVSPVEAMASHFQALLRAMVDGSGALRLESVVRHARAAIRGAQHAAITFARAGQEPVTLSSTGDLPLRIDALQYSLGEGPCVAALTESDVVLVDDLAVDRRFPNFAAAAVELGARSMLSTRLLISKEDRAALNLYSEQPHAFGPSQVPLAAIFAAYASLVLINRTLTDQISDLERALASNREIGIAIGILMAQERCDRDEAFQQLVKASQSLNRRLRDIADEVSLTGQLPECGKASARPENRGPGA